MFSCRRVVSQMVGKGSSTLGLSWNDVNVVKINRGVFYFQEYDVTFLFGGKGGGYIFLWVKCVA